MIKAHRADESKDPYSASAIFWAMVSRIKSKMKASESVVFDPSTGVQKTFLDGKLLYVRIFTPRNPK